MFRFDPGSHRDPSGRVFHFEDNVYRTILPHEVPFVSAFVRSAACRELIGKGMCIDAELVESDSQRLRDLIPEPAACLLRHKKIDFISYPFEWPVSMCVDAALLTLDLQEQLLGHGYSLKDATPYNVQFHKGVPIFIDVCSVEPASADGLWVAYNQFCQFWLYPLLLYRCGLRDLRLLYLNYLEGVPLERVVSLVGLRPFRRWATLIDYLIPALMTKSRRLREMGRHPRPARAQPRSAAIQFMTVRRLRKAIERLTPNAVQSEWTDYAPPGGVAAAEWKQKFVRSALERCGAIGTLLDIGCNTGSWSVIAAERGIQVVAIDQDMACCDRLHCRTRSSGLQILPLWVDIANPSPAIGWANTERQSFLDRMLGRFDCVFNLALVHHLLVSHRVPLAFIAQLNGRLSKRYLVTEFVGGGDRMFQQLMTHRTDDYAFYTVESFKNAHREYFDILSQEEFVNPTLGAERVLFLMEKRQG